MEPGRLPHNKEASAKTIYPYNCKTVVLYRDIINIEVLLNILAL